MKPLLGGEEVGAVDGLAAFVDISHPKKIIRFEKPLDHLPRLGVLRALDEHRALVEVVASPVGAEVWGQKLPSFCCEVGGEGALSFLGDGLLLCLTPAFLPVKGGGARRSRAVAG